MSEWLDALQPDTFCWSQDVPGPNRAAVRSFLHREISKPDYERRAFRVAPCAYWRSDCGESSATVLQRARDAATIESVSAAGAAPQRLFALATTPAIMAASSSTRTRNSRRCGGRSVAAA